MTSRRIDRAEWLLSRRAFLLGGATSVALIAGCSAEVLAPRVTPGSPRLSARPGSSLLPLSARLNAGLHHKNVGGTEVVIYLPAAALRRVLVPVLLVLHGAGRGVEPFVEAHREYADASGVMIVAPYARLDSWDAVTSGLYGRDVESLDLVLQWVFHQVRAHPRAIAISGFSDGASYALGIGRSNGDLFSRIIAYSAHSLIPSQPQGLPPIVVTHGGSDSLVPFGVASQFIVPTLEAAGHAVEFIPFDGGHAVPRAVIEAVVRALGAVP